MNGLQVTFLSQKDAATIHSVLILRLYRNICSSYKKKKKSRPIPFRQNLIPKTILMTVDTN